MTPFVALLTRDLRLSVREGGGAALALGFFALVATMVPFGVGSDLALLAKVGGGVLWVGGGAGGAAVARPAVPGRLRGWLAGSHRPVAAVAGRSGGGEDPGALALHRPAPDTALACPVGLFWPFRPGGHRRPCPLVADGNAGGQRRGRYRGKPDPQPAPWRADTAPDRAAAAHARRDLRPRHGAGGCRPACPTAPSGSWRLSRWARPC